MTSSLNCRSMPSSPDSLPIDFEIGHFLPGEVGVVVVLDGVVVVVTAGAVVVVVPDGVVVVTAGVVVVTAGVVVVVDCGMKSTCSV